MTCLALFDISHDAGFARMRAADDFALRAVLQFSVDMGFHQEPPESPALYSEISAAKLARSCPLGAWLNKSFCVHEEVAATASNRRVCAVAGSVGGWKLLTIF
jgi:hypothetical protein